MQQKWWLVAAGIVGIVLAVLLFPRPDTGSDVPPPDPTNTRPLDFKADQAAQKREERRRSTRTLPLRRDAMGERTEVGALGERRLSEGRGGPNPIAAELAKRRGAPDAVYAGRASGPWTMIRRQLMTQQKDNPEAQAIAEELGTLILDLRNKRRNPDEGEDYAVLEARQKELMKRVRAESSWTEDPVVAASLGRLDEMLAEYHNPPAADGGSEE